MSRSHITPGMLEAISREHISYEIQMFTACIQRLSVGNLDDFERNLILESFLLHARCLFDFLYPPANPWKDDVIADDFFSDPSTLRNALPASLPISNYLKSRTGKEVAHLTYERLNVTPAEKAWQVGDVHDQLGEALVIFFESLSDVQRGWFTTIVTR